MQFSVDKEIKDFNNLLILENASSPTNCPLVEIGAPDNITTWACV